MNFPKEAFTGATTARTGQSPAVSEPGWRADEAKVHKYLREICSPIGEKAKKIPEAFLPPGPAHHQTRRIQV